MGDAGPAEARPIHDVSGVGILADGPELREREVTVLVTGFGPFKSFTTNPSFLIASALPTKLPAQHSSSSSPPEPYTIRLQIHPSPIRVSYATIASLVPTLIQQHNPDYIFHIGVAGGRSNYTLETVGHRDNYKIKDNDDRDGWKEGEFVWKRDGVPAELYVGWDEEDVLERWRGEVKDRERGLGMVDPEAEGEKKKEEVRTGLSAERFGDLLFNRAPTNAQATLAVTEKRTQMSKLQLSVDAGRFLCEFTLFESLAQRWLEYEKGEDEGTDAARENLGRVAFLHVPGGFDEEAVEKGTRVAEAAIKSLVASWEEGRRRRDGQEEKLAGTEKLDRGKWDGTFWKS